MSAYIVNNYHIDTIVSYFLAPALDDSLWIELDGQWGYMDRENAAKVAQCLYAQNVRSVDERYNEENAAVYQWRYIFDARRSYTIGEIAMALDGLEYQSCETDDYHETDAYKIVQAMRKHLLKQIQDRDQAETWEITEVRQSV